MKHTNRPLFATVQRTNPDPPQVGQRHVCIELGWIRGELSHRCPLRASGLSGPSSAQRAIELDDRGQLLALQRGEIELASKETALRIEHLEIAVETSLV